MAKKFDGAPRSVSLEQSVLGALLLDSSAYWIAKNCGLNTDDFYKDSHKIIWQAIDKIGNQVGGKIDLFTVAECIKSMGKIEIVQPYDLAEITNTVGSSANVEFHIRAIQQCSIKRKCYELSFEILRKSQDPTQDPFELVEFIQSQTTDMLGYGQQSDVTQVLGDIRKKATKEVDAMANMQPYNLACVDEKTDGGSNGKDIIVLAGDSGSGKTAKAIQIMLSFIFSDKAAAFASYEMTIEELMLRMLANLTGIDMKLIERGDMDDQQFELYEFASEQLQKRKHLIHFLRCGGMPTEMLRAKAYMLKMQYDIKFLAIDYLQIMTPPKGYKEATQGQIENCRQITLLRQTIGNDVAFLVLSQLRKERAFGTLKRPHKSDLMGSQALEAMATVIILLDNLRNRGIEQFEDGSTTLGFIDVYVDKNRAGSVFKTRLRFEGWCYKFYSLEAQDVDFLQQVQMNKINAISAASSFSNNSDAQDLPF